MLGSAHPGRVGWPVGTSVSFPVEQEDRQCSCCVTEKSTLGIEKVSRTKTLLWALATTSCCCCCWFTTFFFLLLELGTCSPSPATSESYNVAQYKIVKRLEMGGVFVFCVVCVCEISFDNSVMLVQVRTLYMVTKTCKLRPEDFRFK